MNKTVTPIIGLEVHVELTTKSKMFCGCPADHFGKEPNTQTCPVCLGLPGALPVPNQKAIEDTILLGLALNCQINKNSHFDRKQYFYPDLPKSYQISQYTEPFAKEGFVILDGGKKVRVERVHLEEDTGKLQHKTVDGEKLTLIDFNRSSVPLVEIVSYPDMSSTEEIKDYLKKIHAVVRELGISGADMDKGQMRLEPTVNLKIVDENGEHYTPLVELKNINSFNFAALAVNFEIKRQQKAFEETGEQKSKTNKTTRGYDSVKKVTFAQRQKEEANDYRYFPDPDIPPFVFDDKFIEDLKAKLPVLPEQQIQHLVSLGVEQKYAKLLVTDKTSLTLFQNNANHPQINPNKLANFLVNKKIKSGQDLLSQYQQLTKVGDSDQSNLLPIIEKVIADNPKAVEDHRKGKNSLGFFIGQVMKLSGGTVDPQSASKLLLSKLGQN